MLKKDFKIKEIGREENKIHYEVGKYKITLENDKYLIIKSNTRKPNNNDVFDILDRFKGIWFREPNHISNLDNAECFVRLSK